MSKLEYRIWDVKNKKFVKESDKITISLHPDGDLIINGIVETYMDYKVDFFIGLLDSNGNKIYESDCLRKYSDNGLVVVTDIIPVSRFVIGTFVGEMDNDGSICLFLDKHGAHFGHHDDWTSWPEEYEIIGNIHEYDFSTEGHYSDLNKLRKL